jgi:N6-L-threonylcarbamoyladenine synthase
MRASGESIILGVESSCDESAAAVVRGRTVLSNVVFSQVKLHRPYGGVVPEIASRSHVEALPAVMDEAVRAAGVAWDMLDGVAVTYGPGLATSLMVGVSAARALAWRLGKPLTVVNHLQAHIYAAFLSPQAPAFDACCPLLALVVSGGHTCLVHVEGLGRYRLLGQTMDDAAGEAFDKGAQLLGLGYPGGPAIERAAAGGDRAFVRFPRGRQRRVKGAPATLRPELCFSFSGLKTALLYYLRDLDRPPGKTETRDIAASYQEAIVDALVQRCEKALPGHRCVVAGGGVILNARLRERLEAMAARRRVPLLLSAAAYGGDNAAMIAGLAAAGQGRGGDDAFRADVEPNLAVVACGARQESFLKK